MGHMMVRIGLQITGWLLLLLLAFGDARAQQVNLYCLTGTGITAWQPASAANPCPVNATTTITFPTIGAAVPATGIYNALNVAGTLRGVTGLGLGSTFSQTVAVVDGSGNQITTFGSSASVGSTGAAVPSSADYGGMNVAGNLTGLTGVTVGADGVSNTLTAQQVYARIQCYNGATWDRCTQVSAGVAGTPSTQVLSVQGIAAMVPFLSTLQASTADVGNVGGRANVTPTDCSGTISTGGTAQNAVATSSTRRGITIANLDTSEPMWISFTGTAAASTVGSYPLAPATATTFAGLSSYTTPLGFGFNTALSVIAATTAHKFSCTVW